MGRKGKNIDVQSVQGVQPLRSVQRLITPFQDSIVSSLGRSDFAVEKTVEINEIANRQRNPDEPPGLAGDSLPWEPSYYYCPRPAACVVRRGSNS